MRDDQQIRNAKVGLISKLWEDHLNWLSLSMKKHNSHLARLGQGIEEEVKFSQYQNCQRRATWQSAAVNDNIQTSGLGKTVIEETRRALGWKQNWPDSKIILKQWFDSVWLWMKKHISEIPCKAVTKDNFKSVIWLDIRISRGDSLDSGLLWIL